MKRVADADDGAEAMSGLVMGLILKHSRSRGISRLVAVVIGDCCKDDGTGAWPAMRTIAARAGTSERTAQRSITDLEQLGELTVMENAGPRRANLYEINIGRLLANGEGHKLSPSGRVKSARVSNRQGDKPTRAPELHPVRQGDGGCQNAPVEGDRIETEGDTAMSPDPSFRSVSSDQSEDPSRAVPGSKFKYPDDFEEFWRIFPGATDGKRKALKAWKKLTSVEKATAIADLPLRLAANWAGKETDKIPRASTYLNQKRWEDDIMANRIAGPARKVAPDLSPGQELLRQVYSELEDGRQRGGSNPEQRQGALAAPVDRPNGDRRVH